MATQIAISMYVYIHRYGYGILAIASYQYRAVLEELDDIVLLQNIMIRSYCKIISGYFADLIHIK